MPGIIERNRDRIEHLCNDFGVNRLHVFGSAGRDDFKLGESDLDLLVEFEPMAPYDRVDAYFGLLEALRALFGMEVDLVMEGAVKNPYIARDIERTKQVLYAA